MSRTNSLSLVDPLALMVNLPNVLVLYACPIRVPEEVESIRN